LTTMLTVENGTLSVRPGTGVSGNDTSAIAIAGAQAQINAALAGLSYTGMLDFNGSDTLEDPNGFGRWGRGLEHRWTHPPRRVTPSRSRDASSIRLSWRAHSRARRRGECGLQIPLPPARFTPTKVLCRGISSVDAGLAGRNCQNGQHDLGQKPNALPKQNF
jgi:hypothetical protein